MKFGQKTLKAFSYELIADLEVAVADTLEAGVEKNWKDWFPRTNKGILDKAAVTAKKSKRSADFSTFASLKSNLDFSDPIELIVSYATQGNKYFERFFTTNRDKNYLLQAGAEANRFRNLVFHPTGKMVYLTDIRDFLRAGQIICNLTAMSSLGIRFQKLEKDLENAIAESNHFQQDSIQTVDNNLPRPDYEDWFGLVGREKIKKAIISDLDSGHNRVIAITGGGGIGKSALAIDIGKEFLKPSGFLFRHIVWITSKNNFLDYSGITTIKPDFFYHNNYKDFLNQFISGFYQELYATNLDEITEHELEKQVNDIFQNSSRILCIVDNLENIDDPKILDFIKNKILPPNFVLLTSRKGLGEVNKTYQLEPLDDDSALTLFQNICKSPSFKIDISKISITKIRELLKKTNNYPLVIKWCLSLVARRKLELMSAFSELDKPQSALLEFIFEKLYKQLSTDSKKMLRAMALYKELPDRNVIAYIAELKTEGELLDAIFELEQHSLIVQERIESKLGIVETINLLGLAQTFINSIPEMDTDIKERLEKRILEIERAVDQIPTEENRDFLLAQKIAQSKLLTAYQGHTGRTLKKNQIEALIKEAERLAPRFHLTPFFKALIELSNPAYEYGYVKQLFGESLSIFNDDPKVLFEYGQLLRKHKRDSLKEYAPLFRKAFTLGRKIAYGIAAGKAYFEMGNIPEAYEIIVELKDIESNFPIDNSHKLWTSNVILQLAEMELLKNPEKSSRLLSSIEGNIEILAADSVMEGPLLKAKFCSLFGLLFAFSHEPLKASGFLRTSEAFVKTYRLLTTDSLSIKEVNLYNKAIETCMARNDLEKSEKLKSLESEFTGNHKRELLLKFDPVMKAIRKTIKI